MATTPQASHIVQTPSTPFHGAQYDSNIRHAHATRSSTRQARLSNGKSQTPPYQSSIVGSRSQSSPWKKSIARPTAESVQSPPSSTHTTPRQPAKKQLAFKNQSDMDWETSSSRGTSLEPPPLHHQSKLQLPPTMNLGPTMLPTPVKTPRKKQLPQSTLQGAGRVLFADRAEDPMPPSRRNKKGKRRVEFSLFTSIEDDVASAEGDIPIYTDSKDKVPELDASEANPFLSRPRDRTPVPEPTKEPIHKKRKSAYGLDGSKDIEEAFNREEGMVYVFRGKKVFRKFPSEDNDEEEDEEFDDEPLTNGLEAGVEDDSTVQNIRPLRRAAIKPRLLFPSAAQQARRSKSQIEDEEAPTDIDDKQSNKESSPAGGDAHTPVKASFDAGPATPPDTIQKKPRSSKDKRLSREERTAETEETATPIDAMTHPKEPSSPRASQSPILGDEQDDFVHKTSKKKRSPFDSWARSKPGTDSASVTGTTRGKKRAATATMEEDQDGDPEHLEQEETARSKRVKSGPV